MSFALFLTYSDFTSTQLDRQSRRSFDKSLPFEDFKGAACDLNKGNLIALKFRLLLDPYFLKDYLFTGLLCSDEVAETDDISDIKLLEDTALLSLGYLKLW